VSKWFYNIFTGNATGAVRYGSLSGGALISWLLVRDGHGEHNDLRGSDHRSVTPYVHKRRVVLLKPGFVE
jgi:hypothetical protein